MANNIGVTLLNKATFSTVNFHYPFFLSAVHMVCNMAGAAAMFHALARSGTQRTARHHHHHRRDDNDDDDDDDHSNNNQSGESVDHHQPPANPPPKTSGMVHRLLGGDTIHHRQVLDANARRMIWAFSVIFSANIAVGNLSLQHVSVNFNQVMRSLVPAVTIGMGFCLQQHQHHTTRKPISKQRLYAVIPIVVGVAMACFGDMSYTATGFVVTVLCVVLAALKVVASGEMLTGPSLQLHPVDLLGHMAPLALIQCLAMALLNGEIKSIVARWNHDLSPSVDWYPMAVVWFSGILSFSLNICSLQANKVTSPLTLCIAANVKQVLMIAVSTIVFGTPIAPLNGAGILVVLAGSARYSYISVTEKKPLLPKFTSDDKDDDHGMDVEEAVSTEAVPLVPLDRDRMQRN